MMSLKCLLMLQIFQIMLDKQVWNVVILDIRSISIIEVSCTFDSDIKHMSTQEGRWLQYKKL